MRVKQIYFISQYKILSQMAVIWILRMEFFAYLLEINSANYEYLYLHIASCIFYIECLE